MALSNYINDLASPDEREAMTYLLDKIEFTASQHRIGTRNLRGGTNIYNPGVLDRTGWENFYHSLPYDYDIKNDKVFNAHRSTYYRLGDLGEKTPEPATSEAMRTGYLGPDANSYVRPAYLRSRFNDQRPEPAYRPHLSDRTALHYMRADPLEGVLPYSRPGDMLDAMSVSHCDYKWEGPPCVDTIPKEPGLNQKVYRKAKSDIGKNRIIDAIVKCSDECDQAFENSKLRKLKKAYYWPVNPITNEALGGRLMYRNVDQKKNACEPDMICIPKDRCSMMAHKPAFIDRSKPPFFCKQAYLDLRFPTPNYEGWEEVPKSCQTNRQSKSCCPCENTVETGFCCGEYTDVHTGCLCRQPECKCLKKFNCCMPKDETHSGMCRCLLEPNSICCCKSDLKNPCTFCPDCKK